MKESHFGGGGDNSQDQKHLGEALARVGELGLEMTEVAAARELLSRMGAQSEMRQQASLF